MDFTLRQQDKQIAIKLKKSLLSPEKAHDALQHFCKTYRSILEEAQKTNTRLRVLFDLRHGTLEMLTSSAGNELKQFFGVEMHHLSECTLQYCTVVVANSFIAIGLQTIINSFPGTVPTKITSEHPADKLSR